MLGEDEDAAALEQSRRRWSGSAAAVQAERTAHLKSGDGCSKKKKMQRRPWNNLLDGVVAMQRRCSGNAAVVKLKRTAGALLGEEEWKLCAGCSK